MNVFFACVKFKARGPGSVPHYNRAAFLSHSNVLTVPRIEKKKIRVGMLCVLLTVHRLFCLLLVGTSTACDLCW